MKKLFIIFFLLIIYTVVYAENITGPNNKNITNKTEITELSNNTPVSLINFFMALSFVIALIFLATYFFKKLTGIKNTGLRGQKVKMSVISNLPLGDKKFLLIVEIEDKHFFVGVTPNSISYLSELSLDIDNVIKDEEKVEFKSILDRAKKVLTGVKK